MHLKIQFISFASSFHPNVSYAMIRENEHTKYRRSGQMEDAKRQTLNITQETRPIIIESRLRTTNKRKEKKNEMPITWLRARIGVKKFTVSFY